MEGYLFSFENGVVQIGDTLFCIKTGEKFKTTRKVKGAIFSTNVKDKSFESAMDVIQEYLNQEEPC